MEYRDFKLKIRSKAEDGFIIDVESDAGDGESRLVLPFDIEEFAGIAAQLGASVRGARDARIEQPGLKPAPEVGAQLYEALFSGAANNLYQQCIGSLNTQDGVGLRIKLHFDINDPDVQKLASLPWEYIYQSNLREYVAQDIGTTLVRYIDVQRPNVVTPLLPPFRILVVMANPNGTHPLELERERHLIEELWSDGGEIEVEFLDHASRQTLSDILSDDRFHVIHYMGHGAYDEKTGSGALLLEDENGDPELLDAAALNAFLRSAPKIKLAFLNACETAKSAKDFEQDPFAGVATALVLGGLPAVIAMQFPISDDAAVTFAKTFYKCIAEGYPVDEATARGRRAIFAQSGSLEWGTPVLFMRAPDGRLFDLQQGGNENAGEVATSEEAPATPAEVATSEEAPAIPAEVAEANVELAKASAPEVDVPATSMEAEASDAIPPAAAVAEAEQSASSTQRSADSGEIPTKPPLAAPPPKPGSGMIKAAAAIAVAAGLGALAWFAIPGDESKQLAWVAPEQPLKFNVGDTKNVRARLEQPGEIPGEVNFTPWSSSYRVSVSVSEPEVVSNPVHSGGETWDWQIRGLDAGIATLTAEYYERIKPDDVQKIELEIQVGVSEQDTRAYDAAWETITSNSANFTTAGNPWTGLNLPRLSSDMRKNLLKSLQNKTEATLGDAESTLSTRIAALAAWEKFLALEGATGGDFADPWQGQLADLSARTNIDGVLVCTSRQCSESSSRFNTESKVHVRALPERDGLVCKFIGPAPKDCTADGLNWRYLNTPGTYSVEVRNVEGDLLASREFEVN